LSSQRRTRKARTALRGLGFDDEFLRSVYGRRRRTLQPRSALDRILHVFTGRRTSSQAPHHPSPRKRWVPPFSPPSRARPASRRSIRDVLHTDLRWVRLAAREPPITPCFGCHSGARQLLDREMVSSGRLSTGMTLGSSSSHFTMQAHSMERSGALHIGT